ncbi:MAG: cytochrome-c peroxidase, partial [Bacteroidetes bacterium]
MRELLQGLNPLGAAAFRLPDPDALSQIPQDPRNPLSPEKVALGRLLFHETGLALHPVDSSSLLTYSCASCHHSAAGFQACLPQGIGEGGIDFGFSGETRVARPDFPAGQLDVQPIRSPSVLNVAYQPNMLWNGQFGATHKNAGTQDRWTAGTPLEDNLWGFQGVETQAIAGLNVHRLGTGEDLLDQADYKALFDAAFPQVPPERRYDRINTGLAIAAYERTLLPTEAPFQRWLRGDAGAMTPRQKDGAMLFFGKAGCVSCHSGPGLSSMEFHALGMPDLSGSRVHQVSADDPAHRGRGGFTGDPADDFKFKVPQLYNLKDSPFY